MQIAMHQDVPARPAPDSAPGLAHLQRGFEEPAGEGLAELLPVGRQLIAPALGTCRYVLELFPFRPLVRFDAEFLHERSPDVAGFFHRGALQPADRVEPLKEHRAGGGIGVEQLYGPGTAPEGQRMPFNESLLVRERYLEHRTGSRCSGPE